ncbi:Caleosin-domain-containing protein [Whalleya microplaca]|nr:Caleosin-domain-containing protein [Whalleya microplaca]
MFNNESKKSKVNGAPTPPVVTSIPKARVTVDRKPFCQPEDDQRLPHPGTARANIAATYEKPYGTIENGWAERHQGETALQQHCEFFDGDHDGIIWPHESFVGFRRVGFGVFLSLLCVCIIHCSFSYPTVSGLFPDPFFRIYLANVYKDKHGSDTGTYDTEGRFVPQQFENIFSKYGHGHDYLTIWDVFDLLKGHRCNNDPVGWFGAFFEWIATYLMLWPADGKMMKEDIRGVYDGSIFYTIAKRQEAKKQ